MSEKSPTSLIDFKKYEKPYIPNKIQSANGDRSLFERSCNNALIDKQFSFNEFFQFNDSMIHLLGGRKVGSEKISLPLIPDESTTIFFATNLTGSMHETRIKITYEQENGTFIERINAKKGITDTDYMARINTKFLPKQLNYNSFVFQNNEAIVLKTPCEIKNEVYDLTKEGRFLCANLYRTYKTDIEQYLVDH